MGWYFFRNLLWEISNRLQSWIRFLGWIASNDHFPDDWFKAELERIGEYDPFLMDTSHRFNEVACIKKMFASPCGLVCILFRIRNEYEIRVLDGLQCARDVFSLNQRIQAMSGEKISPDLSDDKALSLFWDCKGVYYEDYSWYIAGMDYENFQIYLRSDLLGRFSLSQGKKIFNRITSAVRLKVSDRYPCLILDFPYSDEKLGADCVSHGYASHPCLKIRPNKKYGGKVPVSIEPPFNFITGDVSTLPSEAWGKEFRNYLEKNVGYLHFVWDMCYKSKNYEKEYTGTNADLKQGYRDRFNQDCLNIDLNLY